MTQEMGGRMQAVHVLVDLENNQPTLEDVKRLVPDVTHAWLFYSPAQAKRLVSFEALGDRYMAVPISRPGKNALDFHLTFYVGYLAARNPDAKLIVVAIDRGYGPMIEHAVELKLQVTQVGFGPQSKAAKKVAAKKAPTASAAKKTAKKAPAKKTTAKSAAATKAPAKPAPVPKKAKAPKQAALPVKKVATAKKAKTMKGSTTGASAAMPTSAPPASGILPAKAAASTGAKPTAGGKPVGADKVIANLKKVAAGKRPKGLKQLRGHLASLLGTDAADGKVASLLASLLAADAVRVNGNAIVYGGAITDAAG